jgi:hypothetical protein
VSATITTLEREIAREERIVGIDDPRPSPAAISRRQAQVAAVLGCVVVGLLGVAFLPGSAGAHPSLVRFLTVALGVLVAVYAVEQDRHLRRLARLAGHTQSIALAVADAISVNGALHTRVEVLRLREAVTHAARELADDLAELVLADVVRVRIAGPSGEVPIVAARMGALDVADDPAVARHALRRRRPVQETRPDGRVVMAVPLVVEHEEIAVLEAVSPRATPFVPRDSALVDAFGRGALAALRTRP